MLQHERRHTRSVEQEATFDIEAKDARRIENADGYLWLLLLVMKTVIKDHVKDIEVREIMHN